MVHAFLLILSIYWKQKQLLNGDFRFLNTTKSFPKTLADDNEINKMKAY
jgi:hypothetical protein